MPIILLYHAIQTLTSEQDPYALAVTPQAFATQMAYLANNGYQCLPLVEIVRAWKTRQSLTRKVFAITFDDGYKDNYETALPIMQQHGFTATIFLVTDQLGKISNWDGQQNERALPLMSWDEVRAMKEQGFDFGSHTRTHPRLTHLDAERAREEICTSRQIMADELGAPPVIFAYPYENFNPDMERIVEDCGYLGAMGSPIYGENLFNLWRTEFGTRDTMRRFAFKVSRAYRPFILAKKYLRRVIKGK